MKTEKIRTDLNLPDTPTKMPDERVLSAGILEELADKYEAIEKTESDFRDSKKAQIKELESLITSSFDRQIYRELYQVEFGDFRLFVNELAKELRRRHATYK